MKWLKLAVCVTDKDAEQYVSLANYYMLENLFLVFSTLVFTCYWMRVKLMRRDMNEEFSWFMYSVTSETVSWRQQREYFHRGLLAIPILFYVFHQFRN